ncbi:MmgE/PrpD family protein [Homoserinimonas sp. OAct 916]|uniref:MmgE/PrpD family protein n=1 Tax=Homoserinimonas sp. OAct 916 TaxID=2211450 RepID=UPI000DBE8019|nr:MmgE/PrpD family protein [Homoserinimonas sp. OAct 916]
MIARDLATWGLGVTTMPEPVREAAVRHLLDGIGNSIAGFRSGSADPAIHVARGLGGPPESTILGTSARVSAPAAALANGTLVHALDFDDTHAGGLVHATAVVLPAAFAVGEQVGASGEEILLAAIVGYEAVCRIAAAAPHGFHSRGLHATMVAGVFSSALIASRLCGLDVEQTTNALGIAGSQAGGLLAFLATGASTKQLHPGFASQSGIIAARLASAGATGPETVFDGPHGVFDALASGATNPESIVDALGERWETTRIGIKPYPACQLSHATLDALKAARRQVNFAPEDVEFVTARVHPDSASVVCDTSRDLTRPASPYAAKFSLPWSAAAIIVDQDMTLATFEPASISRPQVAEIAARISIELAPSANVAADARGEVLVGLRDGRRIVGSVERSAGGPDNPLSDAELHAKFTGNVGDDSARIIAAIEALEDQPTLHNIMTVVAKTTVEDSK